MHLTGSLGERRNLRIDAKVPLGDPIDQDNADDAVVVAVFPDGTTCKLDRKVRRHYVRYQLDVRDRRGELDEKHGTCDPARLPSVAGGSVVIEHDGDDDAATPNAPLLTGRF